ncbi:MAG: DNA polymerase I [Bifidobacterium sp.]|nr:DNA polymerase I [Bifidobacterium sp.]
MAPKGTLLVVDGHSLAFRAFYALPVDNFTTDQGQPTNAVYGFLTMLCQVIETERPDRLGIAFDVKGGTFRNQLLGQYKGSREAAPEELLSQLPLIQDALGALGVTYIEKPGYEGDDVIATLATMGEAAGYRTLVLSGDRDAFQLIDDDVTVLYPGYHFKELKRMTPAAVEEKYHVTPAQYPDLAALRGETSDNIPGVPGVGDGFAAKWINQYGSLDGIIEHADEIKGKKGEALRENLDQVRLNRKVNALVRDLDLDVTVADLAFGAVNAADLEALFTSLQFGERTRRKLLQTFNEAPAGEHALPEADRLADVPEPLVDPIEGPAALEAWAQQHCLAEGRFEGSDDRSLNVVGEFDRQDTACAKAVDASWCLAAEGSAKPGHARIDALALMADGHAVCADPHDEALKPVIQRILDVHASTLTVHGFKQTAHMLGAAGLRLPMVLFDTHLAGYLMDPDYTGESVEECAEHFLDITVDAAEASQGTLDLGDGDGEGDGADGTARCVRRAALVHAMARHLAGPIEERSQYPLLRDIELPTAQVLVGMEDAGAAVDRGRMQELYDQFAAESEQMKRIAEEAVGHEVNMGSPKQVGTVLFEELGLTPTKKTKKGSYSTNATALATLYAQSEEGTPANAFLGALLRHRETNKLQQIVRTLIDAINPDDGRIHTTFTQTVTTTGRLSSVDPNLQNIPNRNADGREIRSGFVPGEGFESLLSADYSQVELRIMADLSGDEALIEAFRSGADFHRYVASLVYGIPVDQVSGDQRGHVKAMSYGLAYGLSTYGLSQQLGVSTREANELKDQYFHTFGKVHDYLESLVANARRTGYTETIFGRRRYFPQLNSPNRTARDAAERGALNAPIQGSAADIMKIAMVRARRALDDRRLKSRIVLQIHDELVVEVAPGERDTVVPLVKDAMEHAVHLAVPLDVSTGIGDNWQAAAH